MAILESVEGFRAEVHVDGKALQEFDDDNGEIDAINVADVRTTTKYIEAVTDATFAIVCTFDTGFSIDHPDVLVRIFIDGKRIREKKCSIAELQKRNKVIIRGRLFISVSQQLIQHFQFSPLTTGTSFNSSNPIISQTNKSVENTHGDEKIDKGLGTVSVELHRVQIRGERIDGRTTSGASQPAINEVPEKALKGQAISHSVRYLGHNQLKSVAYV